MPVTCFATAAGWDRVVRHEAEVERAILDNIRTYATILGDLNFTLDWLRARNHQIGAGSRAEQYRIDLAALERTWRVDGGDNLIAQKGHARILNSLMEADAIGSVGRQIAAMPTADPGAERKLFDSLSGPMSPDGERAAEGSNHPRNLFFELRMIAWILKAGLPVVAGEHPDVRTELDGTPILIECKRAFSKPSVRSRILDARHQIRNARRGDDSAVGIIALDLTRFTCPRGAHVRYAVPNEFREWADLTYRIAIADVKSDIQAAFRRHLDDRTEGLITYFDTPTYNMATGRWGTGFALDCSTLRPGEYPILQKFTDVLRRAASPPAEADDASPEG